MNLFKTILTYITVIGIFALHPSLNKGENAITHLQYLVYGNSINLSYDNSINKSDVNIKWECERNHLDCVELTIIENGKTINDIPFESGNQKLVIYYKGKVAGVLHQNKFIKKQAHQYTINLKFENNSITFKGEISGPSPETTLKTVGLAMN